MSCGRIGFFFVFIIFHVYNASGQKLLISKLAASREDTNRNTGIIALLLQKQDDKNIEEVVYDVESVDPPHDEKVYKLYHIMRNTQENEDLDDDAADKLEKTGDILRQALRKRCQKLDSCVKKCPKKKKYTCIVTCQEVFDNYDVCKPKKCHKQNCKTLPPSWY
uniref:Seminal fluid protein HACP020 n=1 Tax=Heliconius melpomene TaxID=34740 RepID=D9HQ76_HELME